MQHCVPSRSADRVSPLEWRQWASPHAARDTGPRHLNGAIVQAWSGSDAQMMQPPLDHHLIVLHQGGPKRVHRRQGRDLRSVNVAMNSCTTIEAGQTYEWSTEGPIAFMHIYVRPDRFGDLIGHTYQRPSSTVGFSERIGHYDSLIAQLAITLASNDGDDALWRLTADHYLDALLIRLAATTSYGADPQSERYSLTPSTVRRVRDFVLANLANPISLDDMAAVAGYSRYHFVRAFRESTGHPPYGYVITQRIAEAQQLLQATNDPVAQIARACGFATHAQFSKKFKDIVGDTPAVFRQRSGRK